MDDNEIIELFWHRSEVALTECQNKYGGYCKKIARNILSNDSDADECLNDTWFKTWNAIPPSRPSRLMAFLGRITRNLSLNRYESARSQKRGGGSMEIVLDELTDIPAPEKADEGEITKTIDAFLRSEPIENADIFLKRYWYLRSVKEISDEYGFNENKITSLLFRMRGRLKQRLEKEGLM